MTIHSISILSEIKMSSFDNIGLILSVTSECPPQMYKLRMSGKKIHSQAIFDNSNGRADTLVIMP